MADIELVVKIPESIWVAIQNGEYCGILDDRTYNAIKNGTPLMKSLATAITGDENSGNTQDMFDLEEIKEIADYLIVYYEAHKNGD